MKRQFTPELINELAQNEIFVFGSNPAGYHVGGAAKVAVERYGAVYGQSEGLQGQSYAIPTIFPNVDMIRPHVEKFISFAKKNPDLKFLVTTIGCGNAGFTAYDIAPLFIDAYELKNVILPESFAYVIEHLPRMTGNPLNSWDSHKDFLEKKKFLEKSVFANREELRRIYSRTFFNTVQIANSSFYITEKGSIVKLPSDRRMIEGSTSFSYTHLTLTTNSMV